MSRYYCIILVCDISLIYRESHYSCYVRHFLLDDQCKSGPAENKYHTCKRRLQTVFINIHNNFLFRIYYNVSLWIFIVMKHLSFGFDTLQVSKTRFNYSTCSALYTLFMSKTSCLFPKYQVRCCNDYLEYTQPYLITEHWTFLL